MTYFRSFLLVGIIFQLSLGSGVAVADGYSILGRKKVQRLDQRDFRSLLAPMRQRSSDPALDLMLGLNKHKKQDSRMAAFERALNYFQVLLNGQAIQEIGLMAENHFSKAGVDSKRFSLDFILSFKKWVDLGVSPTLLIQTWLVTKYRFARLGMEKWLKENPTITPKSFANVKVSKSLSLERKKNIIILHHLKSIQSFIKIRDWEGLKKSKTYQWFLNYGKVDKKKLKKIKMPEIGLKTLDEILYKFFVHPTINGMLAYSKALKWTPPKKGHGALHRMRMSKAHEDILKDFKKVFPGAIKIQEEKDGKTIQDRKDEQTRKWIKEKKELQKKIKPKDGEEWYQTLYRSPVRLFEINSDVWGGTAVLLGSLIVTQDWDESQAAASVVIDANRKFSNKYAGFSVHGTDLEFARPAAAKNDWKLVAGDMIRMQPIAQIMGGAAGALESFYWLFRQGKMRIKGMDKERLKKSEEEGKVSKIPDYIFHGLMFLAGGAGLYRMFMKQAKRALGAFVANPETMKWLATYMAKQNLKKVVGVAVGMGATSSFGSELYQSGVGKKGFQIGRFAEGTLHSSSQSLIFMAAMLKATSMMMAKGNYSQESIIKSAVFAKVADFGEGLADVPETLKMMAMAQNTQQMIGAGIVLGVNAFDTMDISVSGALKAINPVAMTKYFSHSERAKRAMNLQFRSDETPYSVRDDDALSSRVLKGREISDFSNFKKRFSSGKLDRKKRKKRDLNDPDLKKRQAFNMDEAKLPSGQTKDGNYYSLPGTRGYEAIVFLMIKYGLKLSPQERAALAQVIEYAHNIKDSNTEQQNLLKLKFLRQFLSDEHALALLDEGYCGDERLRQLERRWQESGADQDFRAFLEFVVRREGMSIVGFLRAHTPDMGAVAAYLNHKVTDGQEELGELQRWLDGHSSPEDRALILQSLLHSCQRFPNNIHLRNLYREVVRDIVMAVFPNEDEGAANDEPEAHTVAAFMGLIAQDADRRVAALESFVRMFPQDIDLGRHIAMAVYQGLLRDESEAVRLRVVEVMNENIEDCYGNSDIFSAYVETLRRILMREQNPDVCRQIALIVVQFSTRLSSHVNLDLAIELAKKINEIGFFEFSEEVTILIHREMKSADIDQIRELIRVYLNTSSDRANVFSRDFVDELVRYQIDSMDSVIPVVIDALQRASEDVIANEHVINNGLYMLSQFGSKPAPYLAQIVPFRQHPAASIRGNIPLIIENCYPESKEYVSVLEDLKDDYAEVVRTDVEMAMEYIDGMDFTQEVSEEVLGRSLNGRELRAIYSAYRISEDWKGKLTAAEKERQLNGLRKVGLDDDEIELLRKGGAI